jgi:hypothetical protein
MTPTGLQREIAPDGSIVLRDGRGSFTFTRHAHGVLEVRIEGADNGQFGTAPLDEIAMALLRERPLELFVDASRTSMPAVSVSKEWTRFFTLNQKDLRRVHVLVASRPVALTVSIAQHLSRTGKLIQIHSDAAAFQARRASATTSTGIR